MPPPRASDSTWPARACALMLIFSVSDLLLMRNPSNIIELLHIMRLHPHLHLIAHLPEHVDSPIRYRSPDADRSRSCHDHLDSVLSCRDAAGSDDGDFDSLIRLVDAPDRNGLQSGPGQSSGSVSK